MFGRAAQGKAKEGMINFHFWMTFSMVNEWLD
jgi:hypothetical protein